MTTRDLYVTMTTPDLQTMRAALELDLAGMNPVDMQGRLFCNRRVAWIDAELAKRFCVCGRRWLDCDGSRAECHRRPVVESSGAE